MMTNTQQTVALKLSQKTYGKLVTCVELAIGWNSPAALYISRMKATRG